MINNLFVGTDHYNCHCYHKNNALQQSSLPKTTLDTKNADLIICGSCGHRFYSTRSGFFGWQCEKCGSKAPMMAELSQQSLAQGANGAKRDKIKELKCVIEAKFKVEAKSPIGPVIHRPKK